MNLTHHIGIRRADTVFAQSHYNQVRGNVATMHCIDIFKKYKQQLHGLPHFVLADTTIDQAIDEGLPPSGRHEIKEEACICQD